MNSISFKILSILALSIFLVASCAKSDDEMMGGGNNNGNMGGNGNGGNTSDLSSVIALGGTIDAPNESHETSDPTLNVETIGGELWSCVTETVSIQEGAGGNDGYALLNPNAEVIYPGNLLQGNSLQQGTPNIIAVDRAGGSFSTDIADGNSTAAASVDEVTRSNVSSAINEIISGNQGILPAAFSLKIEHIQSKEEFALQLGFNVNSAFNSFSADLGYNSETETNKFIVSLKQRFYTISYDIPTSLDAIFAPNVTADNLSLYVGDGNPATYISSVTYGRIYYMLIESSSSVTEMNAKINASFQGGVTQIDGDVAADYLSELENLSISVFAYGGESQSSLLTAQTNGQLDELVSLLSESSVIESGQPISYVVRSVYNNQVVSTQLATTYDVTNCEPLESDGAPGYTQHWAGYVYSTLGPVGAAYNTTGTEFILINQDGDKWMRSNIGTLEGPFPISELSTGPKPFDKIGAACNIDGNQPNNGSNSVLIQMFDITGTQYAYLREDGTWLSNGQASPIANLANGDLPPFLGLQGVGAVSFHYKDPNGPSSRYMFSQDGDEYAKYNNNPNEFAPTYDFYYWGEPDGIFEAALGGSVSAGIGFYIGNTGYHLYFNGAGDEYAVYYDDENGIPQIDGPFSL